MVKDGAHDGIEGEVLGHPWVGEEGVRHGARVCKACGLQHNVVMLAARLFGAHSESVQRLDDVLAQRAADASARYRDYVLIGTELVSYCTFAL